MSGPDICFNILRLDSATTLGHGRANQVQSVNRAHVLHLCLVPCSDILTPLPGLGVAFDIDDNKGPLIDNPIRTMEQVKKLHALDLSKLDFVGRCVQPKQLLLPHSPPRFYVTALCVFLCVSLWSEQGSRQGLLTLCEHVDQQPRCYFVMCAAGP